MFIADDMTHSYRLDRSHVWSPPRPGHIQDGSELWSTLTRHHGSQVLYHRVGYPVEVYTWDANYWSGGTGRWLNGDHLF